MTFSKNTIIGMAGAALLLAGCTATGVDLESRDIYVDQNAEPAAGAVVAQRSDVVRSAGPTYVTLTISSVFDTAAPTAQGNTAPITSGSGFVVDGAGYVITAGHVAVKAGNKVSARAANGRVYNGKVMTVLPGNDMALIKLNGFAGRAVTPVANQCLRKGDVVFSLGKPHAQGDTARFGALQAMRFGQPVRYGAFGYPDAMVLHMNTQHGESGGPLFDNSGHLAGMVVSTLSDGAGRPLTMAHAIPASRIAAFYCGAASCSSAWQAIASQSYPACGG